MSPGLTKWFALPSALQWLPGALASSLLPARLFLPEPPARSWVSSLTAQPHSPLGAHPCPYLLGQGHARTSPVRPAPGLTVPVQHHFADGFLPHPTLQSRCPVSQRRYSLQPLTTWWHTGPAAPVDSGCLATSAERSPSLPGGPANATG